MNKALLALPLIALLSVAAVLCVSQSTTLEAPATEVTIGQWQSCVNALPVTTCAQAGDAFNQQQCSIAQTQTEGIVASGDMKELMVCQQFDALIGVGNTSYSLNKSGYFNACFYSYSPLMAAQSNAFYYQNIYQPKYFKCAGN